MSTINIRESLRQLDDDTFCKYDLLTMYDSCPLLDEDKQAIAKLLFDKEDPEVIYQKLCTYFYDDDVSGIEEINDILVSNNFETIVTECLSKLKETYDDAKYNDVANQIEVLSKGDVYTTGLSPVDYDFADIEVFVDGNYDEPMSFDSIEDAVGYIINTVDNKITTTPLVEDDDDVMIYTIYDIVEDNDRLTAKCMNESTNDFEDIKLGKINSQKVNELLNNLLNNPSYKITNECKKKIYDNSAPWGLAVQMVPSVDVDGTNGLLSTGSFSGEASFGESVETNFEKDDRVTDGDRQGTVLDYDNQKVLVEWDYSETDDIEWVDKVELSFVECLKESEIPIDTVKKDIQSYLNYHLGGNEDYVKVTDVQNLNKDTVTVEYEVHLSIPIGNDEYERDTEYRSLPFRYKDGKWQPVVTESKYDVKTKTTARKLVDKAKADGKKLSMKDAEEIVDQSYNDKADNIDDFYKSLDLDESHEDDIEPQLPTFNELRKQYKNYTTFKDKEKNSGLIRDLCDQLENKKVSYDIYNHKKDSGMTIFYDDCELVESTKVDSEELEAIVNELDEEGYNLNDLSSIKEGLWALFGYQGKDAFDVVEELVTKGYIDSNVLIDAGYTPTSLIDESLSPYKKEEFKKQLQDELYDKFIDLARTPDWGFDSIAEIEDLLMPVIEVKDYKGEYDNDLVAEIRGELTYDELEDVADSLDPIVQKYDKEAYFEPVTSGITRAYIKIRKNINESSIPSKDIELVMKFAANVYNRDDLDKVISSLLSIDKDLYKKYSAIARDSGDSFASIGKDISDDLYYLLKERENEIREYTEDVNNDISGRYVWFNYNEVGKQPRSDEVVYAYNSKYFDNISHVKLEYSGHDHLNHEVIYVATDNNGDKFRVVVGHVPTSFKESEGDLYDEVSEHLMDLIENEVSSGVVDYYIDNFGSSFIITYNNNLDNIRNEAINLSDILTKNGYKVRDWDTSGNNVIIFRFAKPISLNEDIENDDELISTEQEFDSAATSINSNKLPAVYSMVRFNPGDVVVDFGGGKFDNAVNYLKDQDVTLLVYDPYNRSAEHNKEVLKVLREHGGADAAVNSNVLNVIKEPDARNAVLQNIKKITKKGAPIYITVYEGTGKGNEGPTKSGYQLNRKTADYIDEIGQVFSNVKRKGKLITAINESASDKRLSSTSVKYKGYRISLLTDGSGYAIFDKHGEMEDHGFKSIKDAKDYIDEYNSIYKSALSNDESMHESYSRSDLRQANIDAIEYFIEFEDIYPFPKEKFLASSWKELRDGVAMGMDDDLEIAEGIMEYLQKEIDFDNRHKEIYEDDPQAELTLEIYNKVKREYEKEISKYESISSEAVNEAVEGPKIKITGGTCDTKWIYDTMTDPIGMYFVINNIPCEFKFSPSRSRYMVDGAHCNDVKFEGDIYYKNLTHSGGTARSYALSIPGDVLTSQPKQNQKDYRFTGQYYSTVPAIKYCKESLKELLTQHPDYFYDNILDKLGLTQSLEEANYGGAFDIEDNQYFTKEDIIDFGNKVCELLGEIYPDTFDISDTYIHDNNILFLEVTSKQGDEGSANFKIDMRKIKKPSDLLKFADEMAFYLRQDLEELYTNNSIFTESASDWRYVASKTVPDSDGFLTDYTWYENTKDGRHVFIFGDNDLYDDVDSNYADWETDSYSEARSWFDNYHGFDEEDM